MNEICKNVEKTFFEHPIIWHIFVPPYEGTNFRTGYPKIDSLEKSQTKGGEKYAR